MGFTGGHNISHNDQVWVWAWDSIYIFNYYFWNLSQSLSADVNYYQSEIELRSRLIKLELIAELKVIFHFKNTDDNLWIYNNKKYFTSRFGFNKTEEDCTSCLFIWVTHSCSVDVFSVSCDCFNFLTNEQNLLSFA